MYDSGFRPAPRVVVDAGANIGLSTVFFANKFPQAKIVAIEPEPSNFAMLRDNVAPYPNVTPVQAALWKEDRGARPVRYGEGQTSLFKYVPAKHRRRRRILARTAFKASPCEN